MFFEIKKNLLNILLFLYFFSLVVFDNLQHIKYVYLFNLLLVIYFLFDRLINKTFKIQINIFIFLYIFFAIFTLASSLWSVDFLISFKHSITIILIAVNVLIIYNLLVINKSLNAIFIGILAGVFVNFLIVLGFFGNPNEYYYLGKFIGTVKQANITSTFLLISIFISSYYLVNVKLKFFLIYNLFNIMISIYMIILTTSKKGAMVSLVFILILLLIKIKTIKLNNNFLLILLLTPFFISFVSDFIEHNKSLLNALNNLETRFQIFLNYILEGKASKEHSTEERLYFIHQGLELFFNNILLGNGIRSFSYLYGTYSHNNYVELLANVGLIGFILYYLIYILLTIKIFQIEKKSLKHLFVVLILAFLLIDMTGVSYYSKLSVSILIVIAWKLEQEFLCQRKN